MARVRIGTAGWTLPSDVRDRFGDGSSHLQRYATRFACAEINSSFYRHHKRGTYERWAAAVPEGFRFSVKVPKAITHTLRLTGGGEILERFLAETEGLGEKRSVLLVQLPPSFAYDETVAEPFFAALRERYGGDAACEPRHASWFTGEADATLLRHRVARVAADPAVVPAAAEPGGWPDLVYLRLHGSPQVYSSSYEEARLAVFAQRLACAPRDAWCIFDNTRFGAAAANALALEALQP